MEGGSALVGKPGKKKRLLVEGPDDKQVLYHLLNHHQIFNPQSKDNPFEVKDKQGIEDLLETLPTELKESGLERLGIVVDADINLVSRWQSLQDKLRSSGYSNVPPVPNPNGTIIEQEDRPVVGIWLMPDNTLPGMLEDFLSFLVPPKDVLWPLAEKAVQQVTLPHLRRFPESHRMKAHLHTWLAWQEVPGTPMGLAITRRYLDAANAHAQQLIAWIRRLFELESA